MGVAYKDKYSAFQFCEEARVSLPVLIIVIIAVVLLVTGGVVQSLNFLLWVGVVLLIVAVIAFLLRTISGKK
jgi:Zn-dependent membrane protease YugP